MQINTKECTVLGQQLLHGHSWTEGPAWDEILVGASDYQSADSHSA